MAQIKDKNEVKEAEAVEVKEKQTETVDVSKIDFKNLVKFDNVEKKEVAEIECKIHLDSYTNSKTNIERVFVAIDMKHPFDPFADPIRIQVKNKSRRGKFEYLANLALAKANIREIPLNGTVQLLTFSDKKTRTKSEYAAIEINNIFDDGALYAYIPDEVARGAFVMVAKHYLKVKETTQKEAD